MVWGLLSARCGRGQGNVSKSRVDTGSQGSDGCQTDDDNQCKHNRVFDCRRAVFRLEEIEKTIGYLRKHYIFLFTWAVISWTDRGEKHRSDSGTADGQLEMILGETSLNRGSFPGSDWQAGMTCLLGVGSDLSLGSKSGREHLGKDKCWGR